MNVVQPITDKYVINCVKQELKEKSERDYFIFLCALYTGRRISDVLSLKVKDLKGKDEVYVRESKTGKKIHIPINKELKNACEKYLENRSLHEYIFASPYKINQPMSRQNFYKILREICEKYGLENIGCHSLRKTFGYHHYKQFKDAAILMDIFGHADVSITKRYIGETQAEINKTMKNFTI